jgi:hypothetical protein
MSKKNEFEVRLDVVKHMSKMLLEMSEVDFEALSPDDETVLLEDFEEVAGHLLDSIGFKPSNSEDGVTFTAEISLIDPEKYIADFFDKNGDS